MKEAVILDAVRSPFGRRGGVLREQRPDSLLAHVLDGLIDRVGIAPDKIEDVIDGTVTLAGEQGANPARLAVLAVEVAGRGIRGIAKPHVRLFSASSSFRGAGGSQR